MAADKWNIKNYQESPQFNFKNGDSTRLGNQETEVNTKKIYESHYQQLWKLCLLIGDYKSMFIMISPAPKNALPIKVST